jgi:G3E family GTPase
MSEETREAGEHLREIAAKIRRLARDASIAEAQEELFDLADILDRMAERAKETNGRTGDGVKA